MILYDPACHELADHFLGDDDVPAAENELRIQSLAGAIQQAVEDWCASEEDSRRSESPQSADAVDPQVADSGKLTTRV